MSRITPELDRPLLLSIQDGPRVDLVAIQTLKRLMTVTRGSSQAAQCLAEALAGRKWTGKAILAPSPSAELLTERYASLSHRPSRLVIRLRALKLTTVTWPRPVAGSMRLCTRSDRSLLARFISSFIVDIGETEEEDSLRIADRLIDDRRIFFWVDEKPRAMAAWAARTPNGIRVNFVYTPPEARRRGYASNLVAHLTQHLLDAGRQFCCLHADQANPTSNSIYQKIGYVPLCDSEQWEFGNASEL